MILVASLPVVAVGFLPIFSCVHQSSWEYGFHPSSYWHALHRAMSLAMSWSEYVDMTWPDHRFMLCTALISAALATGCSLMLRKRLASTRDRCESRNP